MMIKTFSITEPINATIVLDKDDDGGNDCQHRIIFYAESYMKPVTFLIRGEWEWEAFKKMIDDL